VCSIHSYWCFLSFYMSILDFLTCLYSKFQKTSLASQWLAARHAVSAFIGHPLLNPLLI